MLPQRIIIVVIIQDNNSLQCKQGSLYETSFHVLYSGCSTVPPLVTIETINNIPGILCSTQVVTHLLP